MKKCFQLLALQTGKLFFLVFLLLIAVDKTAAQDSSQTAPGFPLGVFSHIENEGQTSIDLLDSAGINYIVDDINDVTGNTSFNLMDHKESNLGKYIFYYTKGYYTRWEAERDTFFFLETGFKHPHYLANPDTGYRYGRVDTLEVNNQEYICWATDSTSEFKIDSVLWGPNYRQDKNYTADFSSEKIEYTADYRLALRYSEGYQSTDTVAALSIVYRYKWKFNGSSGYKTDTLEQTYLTVFDFPVDSFKTFPVIYQYPDRFENKYLGKFPLGMFPEQDTVFIDDLWETGIEFQLDWYGVGKLYIDYVDLYDNVVGTQLQDSVIFQDIVVPRLTTYADSFSNVVNLKYWYVNDEPNTMDSYEPMRIVDSIVTKFASFNKPIITEIYPHWRGFMNGDPYLQKFVELTKPKQLMIDRYPFVVGYTSEWGLTKLRKSFQDADSVSKNRCSDF